MSHAIVQANNTVRQLDRQAEPDEQVTEYEVKDASRLARVVMRLLRDVAALRRSWSPKVVDHRDRVVDGTGTTVYRFPHGFGGRVNWWPVDWVSAAAGPRLVRDPSSDNETLALVSYTAGTLTLRIEEAG